MLTLIVVRNHQKLDVLNDNRHRKVILVRNKDDVFCTPEIKTIAKAYGNIRYRELPGGHDDYADNPKPYIDLLLEEL